MVQRLSVHPHYITSDVNRNILPTGLRDSGRFRDHRSVRHPVGQRSDFQDQRRAETEARASGASFQKDHLRFQRGVH